MSGQEKKRQRIYRLLNAETKAKNLPIQILVRLRLLLRRNGIKCLKYLF